MAISDYLIGSANAAPPSWQEYDQQLQSFLSAMEAAGYPIQISSHYRSPEKQAALFSAAVKKYGSPEAARKWVADPSGGFPHGNGASDLSFQGQRLGNKGTEQATALAHKIAGQYGLHFRMGHEPWHIEPLTPGQSPSPVDPSSQQFAAQSPQNTGFSNSIPGYSASPTSAASKSPQEIYSEYLRALSSIGSDRPQQAKLNLQVFDTVSYG